MCLGCCVEESAEDFGGVEESVYVGAEYWEVGVDGAVLRYGSGRRRTTWSRVAVSPSNSPGPGEDRWLGVSLG